MLFFPATLMGPLDIWGDILFCVAVLLLAAVFFYFLLKKRAWGRARQVLGYQTALLDLAKGEAQDLAATYRQLTESCARVLAVERVSLWFFNGERSEIRCEDLFHSGRRLHEKGACLEAKQYPHYFKALEESRILAADDARGDPRTAEFDKNYLTPLGITSMMDVPVRLRGQVIGILCHEHIGPRRRWMPEEQEFAAAIADRVSLAIEADERRQAEFELQNSLALLQATLESTADGILVVDAAGKWTSFNQKFAQMWGMPEWILQTQDDNAGLAFALNQLKEPEEFIRKVQDLYRHPETESFDVLEFKDGRLFERYSKPQKFGDQTIGRVWSFRDVTERRSSQRALQESEEKYRQLVETSHDLIWSVDHEGRWTFLNRRACRRIYGYEPEEMLGRPFTDFQTLEQAKKDLQVFAEIKGGTPTYLYETAMIRKDGAPVYLSFNAIASFDSEGNIQGTTGTATDITARKLAESALLKQRNEQDIIFHSVPAMIWYKDDANNILRCNQAAAASLGLTVEQVEGKNTREFYPEFAEKYLQDDLEVIRAKKPKLGIYEPYPTPQGETRWVKTDKVPYRDEKGNVVGVIVIADDITEQKRAEEALKQANENLQRLSEMKSQFASMVSHELRTPLTVVKEGIGIVLDGIDGPVTAAQTETLAIAKDNVDRLGRLINNVLDYEKLESGKLEMYFDKTDLKRLIHEVYLFMTRPAQKKGIDLQLVLPPQALHAHCDEDKVKEVVINLVDNSLKYTSRGGKVWLRLGMFNHQVQIEVEDSGLGIRKEDQEKIFEMFNRAGSRVTWKIGGWGVGLAVCKMITELHRGQIRVDSEEGKGTKFSVVFPANLSRNS